MKHYTPQNHTSFPGILLLASGSVVLGLVIGGLAYYISTLIYLLFVFALIIGSMAAIVYSKLLRFSKTRNRVIALVFALIFGVSLALGFYGMPYLATRTQTISFLQERYGIDHATAAKEFDVSITSMTGRSGLWGFMKYRAQEGEEITTYLAIGYAVLPPSTFSMKNGIAWLYWFAETILFCATSVFVASESGTFYLSHSQKDWFQTRSTQIGSVSLDDKSILLSRLSANDVPGVADLIFDEDRFGHPRIEIYSQLGEKQKEEVLLSIKQTYRKDARIVKRVIIDLWEVAENEYYILQNRLQNGAASAIPVEEPGLDNNE